ncbi:hypothetical protein P5V15_006167 [Pogonomyrmex californicus]
MAASSSSSTGGEQQYSLRWNDFQSSILSSVRQLRDVEDFVDVTLACDSCSFTAHKIVLSACSPYFRNLLKHNFVKPVGFRSDALLNHRVKECNLAVTACVSDV